MGRQVTVDSEQLLQALSSVFREVGYEAASLSMLQDATGLKKASLYHRFPAGKAQMAKEVLTNATAWLEQHVVKILYSDAAPQARIRTMIRELDTFYNGGQDACLFNMFSSPSKAGNPFADQIKTGFEAFIEALSQVLVDAGFDKHSANTRAEKAIIGLQGSLVLARGLNNPQPFQRFLAQLEDELLSP